VDDIQVIGWLAMRAATALSDVVAATLSAMSVDITREESLHET
jgi:hypothetical protein